MCWLIVATLRNFFQITIVHHCKGGDWRVPELRKGLRCSDRGFQVPLQSKGLLNWTTGNKTRWPEASSNTRQEVCPRSPVRTGPSYLLVLFRSRREAPLVVLTASVCAQVVHGGCRRGRALVWILAGGAGVGPRRPDRRCIWFSGGAPLSARQLQRGDCDVFIWRTHEEHIETWMHIVRRLSPSFFSRPTVRWRSSRGFCHHRTSGTTSARPAFSPCKKKWDCP